MAQLTGRPVQQRSLSRMDGRQLCWIEIDGAGPPVVLIAGAGETILTWAPLLSSLDHVVAYDRAGFGSSDPDPRPTIQSQVADLAALLIAVGPAILVGHSWGGLLAQLVAWEQPSLVLGMVLVDPTHEEVVAGRSVRDRLLGSFLYRLLPLLRTVGVFRRIGRKLAARCTDDATLRQSLEDAYVASYPNVRQIEAENRLADDCAAYVRPLRRPASAPATVLCATKCKAELMQGVLVENTGHYIHHDQPAIVIAAVKEAAANSSKRAPSS